MTQAAPGKAFRKGLTIFDLMEMFPTEEAAREWFEARIWPEGRTCPYCGSVRTIECRKEASHPLPYRCHDCQQYFSVKTGTLMERSPLPLRKWVLAIYLHMTSLKGVSSMKLHRDIGVTQKTAWFMLQRIREVFKRDDDEPPMGGPNEVDETCVGGIRANRSNAGRKAATGRGTADMTAVVGMRDRDSKQVRAQVVQSTSAIDLIPFVEGHAARGSTVCTDDHGACGRLPNMIDAFRHETVNHSADEFVREGDIHTNGIESFWSMLKRAHKGGCHKFSKKHLHRHINEFAGRHNMREGDTMEQLERVVALMVGKRLTCKALIADTGMWSGANGGVRS